MSEGIAMGPVGAGASASGAGNGSGDLARVDSSTVLVSPRAGGGNTTGILKDKKGVPYTVGSFCGFPVYRTWKFYALAMTGATGMSASMGSFFGGLAVEAGRGTEMFYGASSLFLVSVLVMLAVGVMMFNARLSGVSPVGSVQSV